MPLPDAAFDAALPPLEDVAAPSAAAAPVTETATPPAPIVPEAELAAPLTPLATFDPTPEPPTAQQAEAGDAPRALPYRLEVTGLEPVDLDAPFRSLSTLLKDGRKAANGAQIGVRAEEDVTLAERLMRSEGYYDGTASATIAPAAGPDGVVPVTIAATPGTQYRFGTIAITGLGPEPYRIARDALALKVGDPIRAAAVEEGEARIALRLPEQGYPFVKVGQRDILLDDATHLGGYSLPVEGGPKASFGALRTAEGEAVFDLDHLNVFPRFDRGDLYDNRRVDDLRQALIGTGLLSTAAVEPVRTGTPGPDGTEVVDLLVRQVAGPPRTLSASGGYGTGEGVKVTGEWIHRNLFPPEGALILSATAGTLQQGAAAVFRRQNAGQRDRTFQAGVNVARQRFDAFNAETANLSASLSRQSTPIWQKRWTWSVGAEIIASRETPFVGTATRPNATYFIAALPLQLGYDLSDSLLDPTRGVRINLRASPEAQKRSGGSFDQYGRFLLEGSAYQPIGGSIVLAGRARVGSIVGTGRDDIAPSRRLYAGGGGSVRGFGFQQLGPKDVNNDPIGGRSLTEFALEARYRFGNYGIVPFFDAGRVGEGSTPSLSGMRYGAGIGARYYTNFGPMRLDLATPINRQPGESKVALYISIGQAF